jgi:hypothetical protein
MDECVPTRHIIEGIPIKIPLLSIIVTNRFSMTINDGKEMFIPSECI